MCPAADPALCAGSEKVCGARQRRVSLRCACCQQGSAPSPRKAGDQDLTKWTSTREELRICIPGCESSPPPIAFHGLLAATRSAMTPQTPKKASPPFRSGGRATRSLDAQLGKDDDENSRDSGFESDLSGSSNSLRPTSSSSSTDGSWKGRSRCRWAECEGPELDEDADLWSHLQTAHVQPLSQLAPPSTRSRASSGRKRLFACRWVGCRAFDQGSDRGTLEQRFRWLEDHVRDKHGGARPFSCIIQGCSQRFASKSALNTHLSSGHLSPVAARESSKSEEWTAPPPPPKKKLKRKIYLTLSKPEDDFLDEWTMELMRQHLQHLEEGLRAPSKKPRGKNRPGASVQGRLRRLFPNWKKWRKRRI